MEFDWEKWAMQVRKSGKRHLKDAMELPNQEKIRTLGEKETYKYLGILETDTTKQMEMKEKIKKEYLKRARKLLETKLCSRNLIKWINTWDRFWSGPENLSKWTKYQENKWPWIRHYIPEMTLIDYMYQEKRKEEDSLTLKTALMHRYDSSTTQKSTKEDWLPYLPNPSSRAGYDTKSFLSWV